MLFVVRQFPVFKLWRSDAVKLLLQSSMTPRHSAYFLDLFIEERESERQLFPSQINIGRDAPTKVRNDWYRDSELVVSCLRILYSTKAKRQLQQLKNSKAVSSANSGVYE